MKKFIKTTTAIFISASFVVQTLSVYAQEVDFGSYTSDFGSFTSPTSVDYGSYTSPTTNYSSYTSPTAVDYGSYTSPTSVDYGSYTSPTTNYGSYTSPVSNSSYSQPSYSSYSDPVYSTYSNPVSVQVSSPAVYGTVNYGNTAGYGYSSYGYSPVYGYTNYSAPGSPTFINNTTTQCPSGSSLSNGTCVINNTQCPSGTTLISGVCTVNSTTTCPTGSSLINGVCTVNTAYCPSGSSIVNGVCTVNSVNYGYTNYGYTSPSYGYTNNNYNSYQTCWDGSVIPSSQLCASQYKTCSSGSVVLTSQTCYKTCLNGSTIPDYQSCPYSYNTNVTQAVYPAVIKFNNAVTSPTTQVTNNSARCNGIGLIANGVASTGWFEYGETANLGRDTTHTSIGTSATSPFSNVLTNLKANTKYYCRAVMNNQYGTVKGNIVSFTTKGTTINYVAPKPAAKPVTTKKVTVKPTKVVKNEVVCTNWETVSVSNESQSSLIKAGQKLITIQLDKVSGNIYPGGEVNYKLDFKNVSSGRLNDVFAKVVLPEDFTFVSSNVGSYDEQSKTLSFTQSSIDAYGEGIISFKIKVNNNAELGKSVVTTGYVSYTILSSGKDPVADEVTAYSISSISPNLTVSNMDTGAKKVIGANSTSTKTFLPSSLIEWLALISIMFILFILGRSIYATYQDEEEKH